MYNVLLKVSLLSDSKIYDPIFNLFPRDQHIMEELKISNKKRWVKGTYSCRRRQLHNRRNDEIPRTKRVS